MKRTICTLSVLAILTFNCPLAQAKYLGTLQKDQDWLINFDNSSSCCFTAMTIYYLGDRGVLDLELITVPGVSDESQGRVQYTFGKPVRGVKRIIIEVDPGNDALDIPVEINQNGSSLGATLHGSGRLVFDVQ
jgi:hypothetical protein